MTPTNSLSISASRLPSAGVAAIVPAYDEALTLGGVLDVLVAHPSLERVVVVSDGSTDDTLAVARRSGADVLALNANRGKGQALVHAVSRVDQPILLFVDGDLSGLRADHVDALIQPVVRRQVLMNVGIRNRGAWVNRLIRRHGPLLSGLRCLERALFESISTDDLRGYRVETALNWACRQRSKLSTKPLRSHVRSRNEIGEISQIGQIGQIGELGESIGVCVLEGLSHRVKESKRGFLVGFSQRLRMFGTVFLEYWRLHHRQELPSSRSAGPQ